MVVPADSLASRNIRFGERVILVDSDQCQVQLIREALSESVASFVIKPDLNKVACEDADLLIANYDALSEVARFELVERFESLKGSGRLLVYSRMTNRDGYADLFGTFGLTNVIANSETIDAHDLRKTVMKVLQHDVFGYEKYAPSAHEVAVRHVSESAYKSELLDLAGEFAARSGAKRRLVHSFQSVLDEIVTNALFDAPVDEEGQPRYQHLSRRVPVAVDREEAAKVTMFYDERQLGISVEDCFGSISAETVLTYLSRCLRKGNNQISYEKGGAGIGLYQVFEGVSHFIVNLERHRRTEVIGLIDIRGSYRDFVRRGKSFNIFVRP